MEFGEILGYVASAIGGGGLMQIINLRSSKKKADVEVKVDEIKAIHDTVEMVYQPIIAQQNTRIQELEKEVSALRTQLIQERSDHQKEMDLMNKRILEITRALGMRANNQIRDSKGRFKKSEDEV